MEDDSMVPGRSIFRYIRLLVVFARFSLAREMAFRGNFVMKVLLELVWLLILLVFYQTLFRGVDNISGWDRYTFLFFLGCYYTLEGAVETLFLENFVEFSDLVRSGNLDLQLLKPVDEQFLLSFRLIDWSTIPKLFIGSGMMVFSILQLGHPISFFTIGIFLGMFLAGVCMAYSFLLMLSSTAIWMVRNQSLMELWWLFSTLMRYPRDIYNVSWAWPIRIVFSFVLPALLVVSVPAEVIGREAIDPLWICWMGLSSLLSIIFSRMIFRRSIACYRSASS
jgi:ABC-2 type transport system permease protein